MNQNKFEAFLLSLPIPLIFIAINHALKSGFVISEDALEIMIQSAQLNECPELAIPIALHLGKTEKATKLFNASKPNQD
jgi:hypothetical protein